jgi:hypothetical protein
MDAEGRPFSQKAEARNISMHGARVAGLEKQLKPGDVVGVQSGDKKARCKVIWVVDAGPAKKIEAGVKMVEGQPCPWQSEMEKPETATPVARTSASAPAATASPTASATDDKRKFPRRRVPLSIEMRDEQGGAAMKTRTADLTDAVVMLRPCCRCRWEEL